MTGAVMIGAVVIGAVVISAAVAAVTKAPADASSGAAGCHVQPTTGATAAAAVADAPRRRTLPSLPPPFANGLGATPPMPGVRWAAGCSRACSVAMPVCGEGFPGPCAWSRLPFSPSAGLPCWAAAATCSMGRGSAAAATAVVAASRDGSRCRVQVLISGTGPISHSSSAAPPPRAPGSQAASRQLLPLPAAMAAEEGSDPGEAASLTTTAAAAGQAKGDSSVSGWALAPATAEGGRSQVAATRC